MFDLSNYDCFCNETLLLLLVVVRLKQFLNIVNCDGLEEHVEIPYGCKVVQGAGDAIISQLLRRSRNIVFQLETDTRLYTLHLFRLRFG
jgi:hypothetical protein